MIILGPLFDHKGTIICLYGDPYILSRGPLYAYMVSLVYGPLRSI